MECNEWHSDYTKQHKATGTCVAGCSALLLLTDPLNTHQLKPDLLIVDLLITDLLIVDLLSTNLLSTDPLSPPKWLGQLPAGSSELVNYLTCYDVSVTWLLLDVGSTRHSHASRTSGGRW
jgi:hypothetical protein